jgi:lincosamide nucleotidyltransferase A/C/D/E
MVNAPPDMIPGMQADDALTLLSALDERGVHYWLDGGWGVDCLLGEQTRTHNDLDLVVHRQDVDDVMRLLNAQGYDVIRDWLPTSIAFRDRSGREVDLHPVDPTPDGGGDQVLPDDEGTWHYAPPVEGTIQGRPIRCAPSHDQVLMHTGYTPRAVDFEDVRRLARRFELPLPEPFSQGDSCR